ncbi:hypothetical protein NQ318_006080 [Aromia moschata]|uniref:Mitochondrial thiamine pyrophosphate carrier n=1 Tax=Aromia moschata TaxID=1265417 RepID=A0AAV8Z3A5_9CUCU|nr:hypothetical protein NQ318_006080 [Aromia moschata]
MVGYDKKSEKLKQFDYAFAGGASGFVTRATCQPLDVLKIRFQLQVEPISHKAVAKYRSIYQAVRVILHEEGIKAFWKGHVPAQWLSVTYGIVQFWSFEMLSKQMHKMNLPSNVSPLVNFTCGSLAGLWPTVVQIGPHAGAQFMCYKLFDDLYKSLLESRETTLSSSLVAGSLAGLCAKTFIYPLDLAKKRMQIQGFEHGRKTFGKTVQCKGLNDCLIKIYKHEGVLGYFKGLSPSLIKAIFTTALHFSSYEMICKLLLYYRE